MIKLSFLTVCLLLLSIFVTAESIAKECDFDTKEVIEKLEKKYHADLKDLQKTKNYYVSSINCEKVDKQSKYILTLFYNTKIINNHVEHSLIIATIDGTTKEILQDVFLKNLVKNNIKKYQIKIDTKSYKSLSEKKPIGITLFYDDTYRLKSDLYIIEPTRDSFLIISERILTDKSTGFDNDHEQSSLSYSLKTLPKGIDYPPLIFNRTYTFASDDYADDEKKYWEAKLEPAEYEFNGSKYIEKRNEPIFDLSKIAQQTQEGMKFKTLTIKAILFEHSPIYARNISHYINISRNLNKAEEYSKSILILKKLTFQHSDHSLAHFNLANAYWGIGKKYKASLEYATYVNQIKSKGETPLAIALDRSKTRKNIFTKNIERTFKEVHPDIQTVSPLLLVNKENTIKPIAIKPWLQKKLLSTSSGRLLKVFSYEKNNKLIFLFFLKEFDDKGQYHVNLYRFNEESENIKKVISVPIDYDMGNLMKSHNNNHSYQNYQVNDKKLKFYIYTTFFQESDEDGQLNKDYFTYDFKLEKITDRYSGKNHEPYQQFTNHGNSATVEKDFDWSNNITLSYTGKTGKKLLEMKVFERHFVIGDVDWSKDNKWLYFDNHGEMMACIWRFNLETKELSKIVPEHEAEHPYSFTYKGVAHIIYIEGQNIKLARPSK